MLPFSWFFKRLSFIAGAPQLHATIITKMQFNYLPLKYPEEKYCIREFYAII